MNPLQQQKRFSCVSKLCLFHFVLNPGLLFCGFWAAGLGHGDGRLWDLAIDSCLLFNLTLWLMVVTSFPLRKLDIERAFNFYAFLFLNLIYGILSILMAAHR